MSNNDNLIHWEKTFEALKNIQEVLKIYEKQISELYSKIAILENTVKSVIDDEEDSDPDFIDDREEEEIENDVEADESEVTASTPSTSSDSEFSE